MAKYTVEFYWEKSVKFVIDADTEEQALAMVNDKANDVNVDDEGEYVGDSFNWIVYDENYNEIERTD